MYENLFEPLLLKENFKDAVPVVVRISGREYQEGGITPEDVRQVGITKKWGR
jgi:hypothetical protein